MKYNSLLFKCPFIGSIIYNVTAGEIQYYRGNYSRNEEMCSAKCAELLSKKFSSPWVESLSWNFHPTGTILILLILLRLFRIYTPSPWKQRSWTIGIWRIFLDWYCKFKPVQCHKMHYCMLFAIFKFYKPYFCKYIKEIVRRMTNIKIKSERIFLGIL